MRYNLCAAACLFPAFLLLAVLDSRAATQERVFSGPQPGEKTTPFKSIELRGADRGRERDVVSEHHGAPSVFVFVQGLERSMTPLMIVVDEYGKQRADKLKAEFIFLSADRVASQERLPLVAESLKLKSPVSLSVDGAEGPGNYGLNKECLLTIVVAQSNKVTANFALVQPGIADAPAVIAAMARVIGDDKPPTADALREARGGAAGNMARRPEMNQKAPPKGDIPGAAPTDAKLVAMLRRFIQPTNEDAAVDKVLAEVQEYIQGNDDLKRQAIDGWVRVLHLKYGTEYARKAGQTALERWRK